MKQINSGDGSSGRKSPDMKKLLNFAKGHVQAIAVVLVLACVIVYAVSTAMGGKDPAENVPDVPGTEENPGTQLPSADTDVGTGGSKQDPFNGLDISPDGDGAVGNGYDESTDRYWCITPNTREKWHHIYVPYGWEAQAVTGGIRIKPEGFSENATGAEPITFWWDVPVCFGILQEHGMYDALSGSSSADYSGNLYYVSDYYMTSDDLGGEWPVYVVRHVRTASPESEYAEDSDDYAFYVAKPFPNGDSNLFFVGTVDAGSFAAMSTPRFDTVESLVREMFPPSSEPGYPASWSAPEPGPSPSDGGESAADDGSGPDTGGEDAAGTDGETDGEAE